MSYSIAATHVKLLTVKEFAEISRQHPLSVYRRIREGWQEGVQRVGGSIRLLPAQREDKKI